MSKETTETVATLAAKYLQCPAFCLTLITSDNCVYQIDSSEIISLAASCLAQREQPEPSITIAELRARLDHSTRSDEAWNDLRDDLTEMIAAREKESEKC